MGKRRKPNGAKAPAVPNFDEAALSQLTAKLDHTLHGPGASAAQPSSEPPVDERKQSRKRKAPKGEEDGSRGKKSRGAKAEKFSSEELLAEIRALGGDEEDLALIADVESGGEGDQGETYEAPAAPQIERGLQEELAKFASSLGFQDVAPDVDDETSESEQEEPEAEEEREDEPVEASTTMQEPRPRKGKLVSEHSQVWKFQKQARLIRTADS
jgi:ribosome biogenesis protein MAK21